MINLVSKQIKIEREKKYMYKICYFIYFFDVFIYENVVI